MAVRIPIYLDNHATTRPDPRVVQVMVSYLEEHYGNASSRQHSFGWTASAAVDRARRQVARVIGASEKEIVFTSGATESVNLALKGVVAAHGTGRCHIVTASTEHRAVLDTARALERDGCRLTVLGVDHTGMVSLSEIERALADDTVLVTVMTANNEIGTIAPVEEIARLCRSRGVLFHTDATQAVGKIPIDVQQLGVDLVSFSAHKMHGPKGVGTLYVRSRTPRIRIACQIDGGGHEGGLRSGTLNVPAVAGFGEACRIAAECMPSESERMAALRDRLVGTLQSTLEGVRLNGHPTQRLPNNASLTIKNISADTVMMDMKDIALSTGSACSSEIPRPSHVLEAIGLTKEDARSTLRFGLSRFTTEEEIEYAAARVADVVRRHRQNAVAGVTA